MRRNLYVKRLKQHFKFKIMEGRNYYSSMVLWTFGGRKGLSLDMEDPDKDLILHLSNSYNSIPSVH